MQVVSPIDIEDALRIDLGELMPTMGDEAVAYCAPPAPDVLTPLAVCVTCLGGGQQSVVSHEYDLSVDCWADSYEEAVRLANKVQGIVSSLPYRTTASGRQYATADAMVPYLNPDPRRPLLPRATFRSTVGIRGTSNL